MNRIEALAKRFEAHISLPWQAHLSATEKTIFVVYPKEDERRLRAKRPLFAQACTKAGHGWSEILLDDAFPDWMSSQDYAESYFEYPEDLQQKLETEVPEYIAEMIRPKLKKNTEKDALGLFGVGTLFGFTRASAVLNLLGEEVKGRLVVFFPGTFDKNTYRLMDARDGWGYMATPITLTEEPYL